jgi:aryl-alcohol dehydrogenase-like predicted oxidoreductase
VTLEGYGWLLEDFQSEEAKQNIDKVKELIPIATDLGASIAQMAIAWCLKNLNVSSVITGASKPSQVSENIKALDYVEKLTPDVMNRIDNILNNKPEPFSDYR